MLAIVIILIVAFLLLLMVSTWAILKLQNERNADQWRYTEALQEQYRQFTAAKKALIEESDVAHILGKQEGKRLVLDWIKQQVDDGTLEVKVIGTPDK